MRALLWDIDGTLTRSSGAGTRALAATLHARPAALEELRKMRLDGMTDQGIVRILLAAELGHLASPDTGSPGTSSSRVIHRSADEAAELARLPIEERMHRVHRDEIDFVLTAYLGALEGECAAGSFVPQPGIAALLPALDGRPGVLLGLCTGNLERGAELKLRGVGLWKHFGFGGYGSDAEPRPEIVRAAWRRAQARGATEGLVIDDTPRGILAAHDAGLPACGVATGRHSTHDLGVHGAEVVVESFADLERSLSLLLGPVSPRR
jgi:phosphoglycolate phosphatase